jgi:GxxExxY protein
MDEPELVSRQVIRAAIAVHRTLGPGLLESLYLQCLCIELEEAGIQFRTQVPVPVVYRGRTVPLGFRMDLLVADAIIVEVKAVASLIPAHEGQLLTYLRLSGLRVGLLMNFHAPLLKDGLRRLVV